MIQHWYGLLDIVTTEIDEQRPQSDYNSIYMHDPGLIDCLINRLTEYMY